MAKILKLTDLNNHSLVSLILISALTSIVTTVLLFAWVLPVCFDSDPVSWRAQLGISSPSAQTQAIVVKQDFKSTVHAVDQVQQGATQENQASADAAQQADDSLAERQDTVELSIPARRSLDYRLAMERDYDLDYHWTANDKTVYTELRGEAKDGSAPSKTFAKLSSTTGKGFFIIPFNGQFGWHWQNKSDQPITIRLHTKGTYQVIGQIGAQLPT